MPQFQVLPQIEQQPSFGQMLGQALGQGTGQGISQSLNQHFEKRKNQQALQALSPIFEEAGFGHEDMQKILGSGITPEIALEVAKLGQAQRAQQAPNEGLQTAAKALNDLESLIPQEGIGFAGAINPSSKARLNRGKFKSTQAAVLPLFKSMFPRGMTEKEFNFIQENYIPQSHDSEQKIRGKIEGLKQLFPEGYFNKPVEDLVEKDESKRKSLQDIFK